MYTENLKYRVWELRQYLADALKSRAIGKTVCGVFRGRIAFYVCIQNCISNHVHALRVKL